MDAGGQSEATPFFTSTASTILIRGGKVVNAEEETEADVLVVEGIITKVEPDIPVPDGAMIIDARSEFAYVHLAVFTVLHCTVMPLNNKHKSRTMLNKV